jgi:glycosyltransferase involved in cell wall biosynthesis
MGLVTQRIRHLHVFSKVCAWIALSESQRIKHEQMGIPASRLHVIPHFYQPKESPPPPCPNGNVLFLGRLSPEKGVDLLLHAWKSVSPQGRKLVIAGDGPDSDKLKVLATSLNLKNVEFVGYLNPERQRAIWAESAFSVIPSIWREPFGLVLLEAWAQARPCVAFRAGALEELIHHGVDGLLADPLSPASLGKQIQFLIDRPSPCVSMGEAGRNRILTEFAPATWNQKMKHVLQKTLPSSALHDS